jgi:hypothetical protein
MDLVLALDQLYTSLFYLDDINTDNKMSTIVQVSCSSCIPFSLSGPFIGGIAEQEYMVSRSLEKMILIAIGLSTAVIIGVPVLLYTIDTLGNASQLEMAEQFAERLHNLTERVDDGTANNTSVLITIPEGVSITSNGATLTVAFENLGVASQYWGETYGHAIVLVSSTGSGAYSLLIQLIGDEIHIAFSPVMSP